MNPSWLSVWVSIFNLHYKILVFSFKKKTIDQRIQKFPLNTCKIQVGLIFDLLIFFLKKYRLSLVASNDPQHT